MVSGEGSSTVLYPLLRRFKEDQFLIADTPKSTSLSDAALINATAAMRLLVAKFKQDVDWVKQNPRQAILITACIIVSCSLLSHQPYL